MEHGKLQDRDACSNRGGGAGPGSDPAGARCLRAHLSYGCRHSGACCQAGWAIPVEGGTFETLRLHFGTSPFKTGGPLPQGSAAILEIRPDGACVFFERERGRLCAVHRELGEPMLPLACRQFPRVALHDRRGLSISLSHYCPTAAALLLEDHAIEIISAPDSLTLSGKAEGLDAREALPPVLRSGMLTDIEGYATWERRAIDALARSDKAERAIATIHAATKRVLPWTPEAGSLSAAVDAAFDSTNAPDPAGDEKIDLARIKQCLASVPKGLAAAPIHDLEAHWPSVSRWWPEVDRVVRAYLAARLFGNWIAYHGRGLHAVVEYLRVCLAVLKIEAARQQKHASVPPRQAILHAIRNADLLLVHLSEPQALARLLS